MYVKHFFRRRLSPLWKYTALKHAGGADDAPLCLSPLWKYTALKHAQPQRATRVCLSPLWKYTALKQGGRR